MTALSKGWYCVIRCIRECACLFNYSQTVMLMLGVNNAGMWAVEAEHLKVSCFVCGIK